MQKLCALVLALLLPLVTGTPMARAASQEVITGPRQLSQAASPIVNHWSCFDRCGGTVTAGKKLYVWTFYTIGPPVACGVLNDSQGNTYTLLTSSPIPYQSINTYVTTPAVSGADIITMTTTRCFFAAVVINSTSGFDVGTAIPCICSSMFASVTTTQNRDLLFAGGGGNSGSAWNMDPPSEPGWIFLEGTGTGLVGQQANLWYKQASAAGAYSATIATGVVTTVTWESLDSFKP